MRIIKKPEAVGFRFASWLVFQFFGKVGNVCIEQGSFQYVSMSSVRDPLRGSALSFWFLSGLRPCPGHLFFLRFLLLSFDLLFLLWFFLYSKMKFILYTRLLFNFIHYFIRLEFIKLKIFSILFFYGTITLVYFRGWCCAERKYFLA